MSKGKKIWYVLMPAVLFLLCNIFASAVITALALAFSGGNTEGVFSALGGSTALLATLGTAILTIIVMSIFRKKDEKFLGKDEHQWPVWKAVIGIAVVCAAGVLGNYLIEISHLADIFPYYKTIEETTFENQNPILLYLTVAVAGPLGEELTFRGMMQRRARVWMRPGWAIVISALVFGLCHMNMVQLIYAFPMGLLLGFLYEKSGNLLVPVLAHMAANAVTMLLF